MKFYQTRNIRLFTIFLSLLFLAVCFAPKLYASPNNRITSYQIWLDEYNRKHQAEITPSHVLPKDQFHPSNSLDDFIAANPDHDPEIIRAGYDQ